MDQRRELGRLLEERGERDQFARPIRYSHSPFETIDPADLAATIAPLKAFLTTEPV